MSGDGGLAKTGGLAGTRQTGGVGTGGGGGHGGARGVGGGGGGGLSGGLFVFGGTVRTASSTIAWNTTAGGAFSHPVSVTYQTANGTAEAGCDYVATGPTVLTFPAGATSQMFSVPVLGDTAVEADETIRVNLTNPVGMSIQTPRVTVTIVNDDVDACTPRPRVSASAVQDPDGRLRVTVTAGTLGLGASHTVSELQFADGTNSTIDVGGLSA